MKKGVRGFVFLGIVSLILICGYVSAATPQAIDLTFAKCGSADGKLSMIKPTGVAACEKGTSSTVTESSDKQSWIWSCSAENLGTLYASPCSSYKKIAEVIWISEDDDGGCDNSNYWNMWTGTFNSKSGGCGWLAHNTIPGQPTNSGCWVNAKEQDGGIFGGDDCGYGIANINYIFDGTTLDNSYKKFEYQSKYGGNDNDANCLLDGWSWAISGGKNSYICKNDGYWYTCDSDTFGKQIESNGKTFKCDKEARISYTNSYILNPRPDLNTNNAEATIEMEQCDASHIGSIAATYPDEYTVVFYECIQQLSNTPFDFYIWQPIESDCKGIAGQISCCSELQNIDKNLNENYILTNNIDCSDTKNWNHGAGFDPIGENGKPFTGSFDGKGYKISNLYINRGNENFVGLFGITASSTKSEIKNVVLENPFVKGQDNVGGFAGSTTNTDFSRVAVIDTEQRNRAVGNWMYKDNPIEEITTVGKGIIGRDFVGGIAGEVFTGDISESFSETLMSGNSRVGGLVGSYVSDEYASIPKNKLINSFSNSYIYHVWVTDSNGILGGGLVGETAYTSITNSYFSGFISPQYPYLNFVYTYKNKRAGGLIGTMYSGKIENSFSSAPIISFKTTQTLFNNKRSSGLIAMKTKLTGKSDPIISNIYWGDFFGDDMDQIYFCVGICTNECYLDKTRAKENENCIIVSDSHLVPENPRHSYSYFSATGTTYQSQCNSVILSQIITNTKYYTSKCNSGLDVTNHLNYFMGSNSRDPLNLWNFNIIWKTESSKYPRLKWETGGIPPVTPTTTAECGNAKNTPTSVAPTTNLCASGNVESATTISVDGKKWQWTCLGTDGIINCNVEKTTPSTVYTCITPYSCETGTKCTSPLTKKTGFTCETGKVCCGTAETPDTIYCGGAHDNEFTSLSELSTGLCVEGKTVTNFDDNADSTGWIWKCGSSSCWATKIMPVCNHNGNCEAGETCSNCPSDCTTGCGGTVTYCGDNIIQKPNSGGIEEVCDDGTTHNGVACNPATGGECTYCTADCLSTITIEEDENGNQCSFKGTQDGKCSTGADSVIINYESVSGNDPECDYNIPSPQTVSCPARLPFFTLFNLVITLVCVGLIYIVIMMLRRRKVGKGKKRR